MSSSVHAVVVTDRLYAEHSLDVSWKGYQCSSSIWEQTARLAKAIQVAKRSSCSHLIVDGMGDSETQQMFSASYVFNLSETQQKVNASGSPLHIMDRLDLVSNAHLFEIELVEAKYGSEMENKLIDVLSTVQKWVNSKKTLIHVPKGSMFNQVFCGDPCPGKVKQLYLTVHLCYQGILSIHPLVVSFRLSEAQTPESQQLDSKYILDTIFREVTQVMYKSLIRQVDLEHLVFSDDIMSSVGSIIKQLDSQIQGEKSKMYHMIWNDDCKTIIDKINSSPVLTNVEEICHFSQRLKIIENNIKTDQDFDILPAMIPHTMLFVVVCIKLSLDSRLASITAPRDSEISHYFAKNVPKNASLFLSEPSNNSVTVCSSQNSSHPDTKRLTDLFHKSIQKN